MKVLDNLPGVLHLEHFLSNPFPYEDWCNFHTRVEWSKLDMLLMVILLELHDKLSIEMLFQMIE